MRKWIIGAVAVLGCMGCAPPTDKVPERTFIYAPTYTFVTVTSTANTGGDGSSNAGMNK